MASIHRHPNSRFWYCTIGVPGFGQIQRTTKHTDKRKALEFAQKLEKTAQQNTLTDTQARKVLAELYALRNGEKLPGSSAREFFGEWVSNKIRETAESTGQSYASAINSFVEALGSKADLDI